MWTTRGRATFCGLPVFRRAGRRTVTVDTDEPDPRKKLIVDEHMDVYPRTYTMEYYGYQPNEVALSFDDGPDPKWTPKILDILEEKNVKGTFMMIGAEAQENIGLHAASGARRPRDREPHISRIPTSAKSRQQPARPGGEADGAAVCEQAGGSAAVFPAAVRHRRGAGHGRPGRAGGAHAADGFTVIGNKIDTDDWDERVRKTPQEITQYVLEQLDRMKTKPQFRGSIILMHDGGGDRSVTVAALPVLIDTLRAKGYTIVPVSSLMGKTTAQVMPPLTLRQYLRAIPDSIAFSVLSIIGRVHCAGVFCRRRLDERAADTGGYLRDHRPVAAPASKGFAGFQSARRGADSRVQRREGDRAHGSFGAELRLQQSSRDRDRRRIEGSHLRGGARGLPAGNGCGPPAGADKAQWRQGGGAELRT